jgi:molybdopterin-biosynthesis enzyme MoeA-like protein
MNFGVIIIGDEILSGKRQDKHLAQAINMLRARGLSLAYAEYVGDSPALIVAALRRAFASGDAVFSFGGIGSTPDDHTRQSAAMALGCALALHPQAAALIHERMQDLARERAIVIDPESEDYRQRLEMAVFPVGASIIPNPYNKIAGFSCAGVGGGAVHFLPGFPIMAWPMAEQVLDTHYRHCFTTGTWQERSVIVFGAMEASLTPLMLRIEQTHPVKVFSLPSLDHPEYGRHIELGVKGTPAAVGQAFEEMRAVLAAQQIRLGPELVRE